MYITTIEPHPAPTEGFEAGALPLCHARSPSLGDSGQRIYQPLAYLDPAGAPGKCLLDSMTKMSSESSQLLSEHVGSGGRRIAASGG